MAPVNPSKVAVENTDDIDELRNIELQAAFLFDEFLRLYHPADTFDNEQMDSPVPVPAPPGYKAKSVGQGYVKYSGIDDNDFLECDCSPLPGPKIAQEEGGVKNGRRALPRPLAATCQAEISESDYVAQGSVQETTVQIDPEQAKQLSDVAAKLQGAGDQLVERYGSQVGEIQNTLVTYVRQQGTKLTYDAFAKTIQHEVEQGTDINFTTFMMTLHLSYTVCAKAGNVCAYLPTYFRQYVTQRYPERMQQSGGVANFVLPNRRVMPQ